MFWFSVRKNFLFPVPFIFQNVREKEYQKLLDFLSKGGSSKTKNMFFFSKAFAIN